MPRVLFVIPGPAFGGAHRQVLRLAPVFEARGWESLVLLPDEEGNAAERLRAGGVEVLTMELHRVRASPDPRLHVALLAKAPREVRSIRRLIREHEIDLVQAHGPTNPHGAIAAHREGVAVVWQLLDSRAPMWLRRVTMPVVVRLADAITSYGEALAREHPGALSLGDRLVVVAPDVDPSEFDPASRSGARAELGVPADAPVVGTVGVRNPQKGHEYLLRAAAVARERHPGLAVRILGAASPAHPRYERALWSEAGDLGFVRPRDLDMVDPTGRVPELLPALDVFAMTSVPRSEGLPTAILEAMACGLPVVATDVGSVSEAVEDGVTGFVVPPEDEQAIAAAISRLVGDPELRRAMGEAGRSRVLSRFQLDEVAAAHLRAYELALAHRDARSGRALSRG